MSRNSIESQERPWFHQSEVVTSDNLLERFKSIGANLKLAPFAEVLNVDIEKNVGFVHKAFRTHTSSAEKPNIIFEHGASFCSLLIAMDSQGNIVSLHDPLIGYDEQEIEKKLKNNGFLENFRESIGGDCMVFVTGTGAPAELQKKLVENLESIFQTKIDFLFLVEDKQESKSFGEYARKAINGIINAVFRGNRKKLIAKRLISDIAIIPQQVSASDQTELIIPHNPEITDSISRYKYMGDIFRALEEKFGSEDKSVPT